MARTTAPRDGNRVAGMIAASNDVNETPVVLWADPTTHRLLVDINGADLVVDGDAVDAATTGYLLFGTDGSNYQALLTDSGGRLQVDIIDGGGAGVQYTEGDTDATITGTAALVEGAANALAVLTQPLTDTQLRAADVKITLDSEAVVLGAGTAAIGKLAPNDGVDIGDVTINNSTIAVTQSGTWDEVGINDSGNSITVDAPVGTPVFVRLSDGSSAIATLPVSLASVPSHAVTNAGVFVVQENGSALTSLQLIDDVVYVDDTGTHATGTSKGVLFMAAATPTDTSVNANDIGAVAMTTDRKLHVSVQDSLPAGTNGIGKLTSNSGVTIGAVELVAAQTLATVTTVTTVTTLTGGGIAHDSADSGNPHKMGGKAVDIGTSQTDVTANDRTNWNFTRQGVPFVIGGHPNIVNKHIQVTDADGAQTDAALITVSAGSAIVVTRYSVTLDAATTATGGVAVRMGFGTANTPSNDANSGVLAAHSGIPAGGGIAEGDGSGIIGMGASNEDLRLTCEDPAGGNIDIVISYFVVAIG